MRLLPALVLLFVGCATTGGARHAALNTLVDEAIEAGFVFQPTWATSNGDHRFDGQLEDYSAATIGRRVQALQAHLARVDAIDPRALSFDERIDHSFLRSWLTSELHSLTANPVSWRSPLVYAGLPGGAIDVLMKRDFAPAGERLVHVIERLEAVPRFYAQGRENLQRPPKEFTDLAIRMSRGSVSFFQDTVPAWAKEPLAQRPELKARFDAAVAGAVKATDAFATWLSTDLLPRSDGAYALGADAFLAKLQAEEQIALPLDVLLARGEAQLQKDLAALKAAAAKVDPAKSPAEVIASLTATHPSAENLLGVARDSLEEARRFLVDHHLLTIPSETRPLVTETPGYARSGTFASMDTPAALESSLAAYYYVTPVEPEWDAQHREEHLRLFNPFTVSDINVHEVWPGHYLQFLWAPRYPTKLRKVLWVSSNVEGWAHYAEQMMMEEGFHADDPRYLVAQLQEALLRDCRYVVGIKLHTAGWTVEQGARFMVENAFQEPANAYEEARRGAYNPTYLYYAFGKLEILGLRDEYRQKTGKSLAQFHDAFLEAGGLPLPLMREVLFRR